MPPCLPNCMHACPLACLFLQAMGLRQADYPWRRWQLASITWWRSSQVGRKGVGDQVAAGTRGGVQPFLAGRQASFLKHCLAGRWVGRQADEEAGSHAAWQGVADGWGAGLTG